ncbi:Mitogen-activated protein [Vigna angularis]|uniref:mitogen-activated protein kinase kinase kinase n=1 Tax=Phaseolus angularis TaxID=3914 RepID=A0A8T0K6L3_PHAAN|nr:Mitogen-activated protein [Vigna angularis]
MAKLAKEGTTVRRVLESLFRYFDSANLWSPEHGLALSVLLNMQSIIENSGQNTHLLLSILVKHLDHKNVLKNPNMQLDIVGIADAGPVLDTMAVLLENMSNITVMARTLIAAVYRTAQIVASIPNISYQNKARLLLLAMVHADHETRVGAHRVFSVVLVPSSVCPQPSQEFASVKSADIQRMLSRNVSVFSSSAALFEKLERKQSSLPEDSNADAKFCGCRRNVYRTHASLFTLSLSRRAPERSQMQDIFGSVRRSLVFRGSPESDETSLGVGGSLVDKISYCIRTSRVFSKPSPPSPSPSIPEDAAPPIRWRKGELIGCGAFGQVYVGMNIDSGELLAVKQVLIAASSASKEKAQAHIKELEEEVKLLKDLSHPNIVRYLGTVREEDTLNILLEFVPGGSISSLLGKFGAFPEAVIRTYTKQLLLGLEYLHKNGIMHRDIKGANILVDNKGCIKLADFGASKQVVELATISGAKSMKGTPYWMAPEVILQTGHSFSADIWSVGCTVIEMATGKPPWSQQYQQEVAVLFHIGTTKSHPPIPDHLSAAAKDFLLKCLQKEPVLRSSASELLQVILQASLLDCASEVLCSSTVNPLDSGNKQLWGMSNDDDDMCVIDDKEEFSHNDVKYKSLMSTDIESFNPMSDPSDDWGCKFDASSELENREVNFVTDENYMPPDQSGDDKGQPDFSFPGVPSLSEEDDELTESKIKAFLDEKALELKKLQTPLYEEFYNSLNTSCSPNVDRTSDDTASRNFLKLPPKSRSPNRVPISTPSKAIDNTGSPGSNGQSSSTVGHVNNHTSQDIPASPLNEWKGVIVDSQQQPSSPSLSFSERQRKWKEELDQELERKREMMRQAGMGGKTSSPKDRALHRQRERTRFASPSK